MGRTRGIQLTDKQDRYLTMTAEKKKTTPSDIIRIAINKYMESLYTDYYKEEPNGSNLRS